MQYPREHVASMKAREWLELLPFPVAYPLWYALDSQLDTHTRLHNVLFAAQQAVRVTGLLLLADYLESSARSAPVNEAVRALRTPHWGEWTILTTRLACFWRGELPGDKPERLTSFEPLVSAWRAVAEERPTGPDEAEFGPLIKGMRGNGGDAATLNEAVWALRNRFVHGTGTRTRGTGPSEDDVSRYFTVAAAIARRLFVGGRFDIVRGLSDRALVRLRGAHPDRRFFPEPTDAATADALARTGVAVLLPNRAPLSLYPLFIPESEGAPEDGGGLVEPITMVDEIRPEHVVLIGVLDSKLSVEHARPLNEALKRKATDLSLGAKQVSLWAVAEWSRAATREALKNLGDVYTFTSHVARQDVDDRVLAYDEAGRALLIVGEPGSGRTSLLAALCDKILGRRDADQASLDVIAWVDGRSLADSKEEADTLICRALLDALGISRGAYKHVADLLSKLHGSASQDIIRGRRMWVLLDDFDDHPRFVELASIVRGLVLELRRKPWLRVVVTIRSGAQRVLFDREQSEGAPAIEVEHGWHEVDGTPYVVARPFSADELSKASERMATMRGSPRVALEGLSAPLRGLLANPWYLRIFNESVGSEDVGAAASEDELLDAYLARVMKRSPSAWATLGYIARRFLETGACELSHDEAEGLIDRWRETERRSGRDPVLRLDPLEDLVTCSVLRKPTIYGTLEGRKARGYVFSHTTLCERALVRALLAPIAPRKTPSADEVEAILDLVGERASPAPEIKNAIAAVGRNVGSDAGDEVFERLLALTSRSHAPWMLANAIVARALREGEHAKAFGVLTSALATQASLDERAARGWSTALAEAVPIACARSTATGRTIAELLAASASFAGAPHVEGGEQLRSALERFEFFASTAGARDQEEQWDEWDARQAPGGEKEVDVQPDSRSGNPSATDVTLKKRALELRRHGERAMSRKEPEQAREMFRSSLAELQQLLEHKPGEPDVKDAWARVAGLLAGAEHALGARDAARDLLLRALALLLSAGKDSESSLATALTRCYLQLRYQTRHRRLRALYMGRVSMLLRAAPQEGIEGLFGKTIAAIAKGEERVTPAPLTSVRCCGCGFQPSEASRWTCACGHSWNMFDTRGICPRCEHEHATTACLACSAVSAHGDWYAGTVVAPS
jgi:hypothetical protein